MLFIQKKQIIQLLSLGIVLQMACAPKPNKNTELKNNSPKISNLSESNEYLHDQKDDTVMNETKIVFVLYKIYNQGTSKRAVLLKKESVEGKLKSNNGQLKNEAIDNLVFFELDGQMNPIEYRFIENPLKKNVEYINENGMLQRKEILQDSAEIFLRFQPNPNTRFIGIGNNQKKISRQNYIIINPID